MMIKEGHDTQKGEYVDHATITIRLEKGCPVVEPEVVYLNNNGKIKWCVDTAAEDSCEIRFKMNTGVACPFTFNFDTGSRPSTDGCFQFPSPGEFDCHAIQKKPEGEEEFWEYDILINGTAKDPVIRLKTPPGG